MPQDLATIDSTILDKLDTWEGHVSAFIQLEENTTTYSWLKADILLHLISKYGEKSVDEFSKEVGQPRSTIVNYVRTARAFPPDTRLPVVSFSHHFQASLADSYDDKEKVFLSDTRQKWVEKAADEEMSTRRLAEAIREDNIEKQILSDEEKMETIEIKFTYKGKEYEKSVDGIKSSDLESLEVWKDIMET